MRKLSQLITIMINRINQFINSHNISVRAFEQQIGASNGLIRKAIANNTDIQSKWLTAMLENYPHVNALWLLTGNGPMLNEEPQTAIQKAGNNFKGQTQRLEDVGNRIMGPREQSGPASTDHEAWLRSIIESQQRQLESQQETIKVQAMTIEKLASKGCAADAGDAVGMVANG